MRLEHAPRAACTDAIGFGQTKSNARHAPLELGQHLIDQARVQARSAKAHTGEVARAFRQLEAGQTNELLHHAGRTIELRDLFLANQLYGLLGLPAVNEYQTAAMAQADQQLGMQAADVETEELPTRSWAAAVAP
jgi:hypothetical protein